MPETPQGSLAGGGDRCYHFAISPAGRGRRSRGGKGTMAQLLIRDLAPETIDLLKARARKHRRSLQGEVRLILEKEAEAGAHDAWELADRIRASFGGRRFGDSAALIREDRDR